MITAIQCLKSYLNNRKNCIDNEARKEIEIIEGFINHQVSNNFNEYFLSGVLMNRYINNYHTKLRAFSTEILDFYQEIIDCISIKTKKKQRFSAGFAALREDKNRERTRTDANGNANLSVELL